MGQGPPVRDGAQGLSRPKAEEQAHHPIAPHGEALEQAQPQAGGVHGGEGIGARAGQEVGGAAGQERQQPGDARGPPVAQEGLADLRFGGDQVAGEQEQGVAGAVPATVADLAAQGKLDGGDRQGGSRTPAGR